MLRIHFTAEDLARVPAGPGLGATCFSLVRLRRRDPRDALGGWSARVVRRSSGLTHPYAPLFDGGQFDLLTVTGPAASAEEGLTALLGVRPEHFRAEIAAAADDGTWSADGPSASKQWITFATASTRALRQMQYGAVADAGDDWSQTAGWYPEVAAAGDARRAWQAEFERQGVPLRTRQRESVNPHRTAIVENGELHADLLLSPWKRQFRLALRAGRANVLQGYAPDLATAADAARLWLSRTRPGHVAAAWPFLGSVALAEARERGDSRESSWLLLYENHCADRVAERLSAFVALAFHQPQLRVLRPYTSHWTLCFSSTPRWPYSRDHPTIAPVEAPGRYLVHTRDGRTYDETDAAGALALVLAELPDCFDLPSRVASQDRP